MIYNVFEMFVLTALVMRLPKQLPMPLPFEQIFADYFDYGGRHFLFVGDRFSGWANVFATVPGLNISGAAALVCLFRTCFATFGWDFYCYIG